MARYRKKPVVIEAYCNVADRHGALAQTLSDCPSWLLDAINSDSVLPQRDGTVIIKTLEGDMKANDGDWIIRGVKGEIYPCKPYIFEATYEPTE